MTTTAESIRAVINLPPVNQVEEEVKRYLSTEFNDLDSLLSSSGGGGGAGPSRKKRKTLDQEIAYYERLEEDAAKELEVTRVELPKLLDYTHSEIQELLNSTQGLSTRRFGLVDTLSRLIVDLNSEDAGEGDGGKGTILQRLEGLQDELGRLEVSSSWVELVERVVLLSEEVLDKRNHTPSPLSTLGRYRDLCEIVSDLKRDLPAGMTLLEVVDGVREKTWAGLKDVMSKNLIQAAEALKWPTKIIYPNVPAAQRRAFERGYQDLLYLQAEGERLHPTTHGDWTKGDGLYPLQALVKGIELRFRYHFQGSRNTNRVDKPEWAFANILDQIYEHQSFIKDYLQPLTTKAGYEINVKSEFTLLLLPILLQFLKSRIPHLLDHPALLAHTIYQTILFDESVKTGGFELGETSLGETEWEGLSGVILKQEGWFGQWVDGERKFGENQINEIISSADAWNVSEDLEEESLGGLKATVSSRQIKALIEQITDRYSPLPQITHKLPFLTTIQLPLLSTYHARITFSLDAFETLSSAFVRSVPGALTQMRGGIHVDQRSLTGGSEGLGRLMKAYLSTGWIMGSMREWADDPFFIEMSDQLINTPSVKYKLQADPYLSNPSPNPTEEDSWSVWDRMIETYEILGQRGEEMIVRLITAEVEGDLKKHLQRRWDQQITPSPDDPTNTHPSLISALVTLSTSLSHLSSSIPQTALIRIYRYLVENLVTHISHRAVYSGWSKFTSIGGHSFSQEIQEFITTSQTSLHQIPREVVERPWGVLVNIGKVLELPNEGGITFQEAMAAAWGGDGAVKEFRARLRLEFGVGELQALMRRRVECWR